MVEGGEWIVILLLALVVFGPERLPELSRKLGGWARELRGAAREMREGLEAEVSEVQKAKSELTDPLKDVRQAVRDTARLAADNKPGRLEWKGPKPVTGPTPEDALADLDRIEAKQPLVDEGSKTDVTGSPIPVDEPSDKPPTEPRAAVRPEQPTNEEPT